MMRLALTVPLGPAETATGFASRLGARNGSRYVQDFVQDMGFSWRDIIMGDDQALSDLARLSGAPETQLMRQALRAAQGRNRCIGAETVHLKMLRVVAQHVCPLCVSNAGPVPGSALWQFEAIQSCAVHDVALIELPLAVPPRCHYDLAGRLADNRALIDAAARAPEPRAASGFERYLAGRIVGPRQAPIWLDDMDIGTVWRASEYLGVVLQHGAETRLDELSPRARGEAAAAGFAAIAPGPDALHDVLREVHMAYKGEKGGFYTEFAPLARWLQKQSDGPAAALLLDTIREFIEATYPVAPGEEILGRECARRRIHSVLTAAEAHGVNWTRMNRLVRAISEKPGHCGLPAPDHHLWIQADAWDPWLARYSRSLNPKSAAAQLGVRHDMFKQLIAEGFVSPIVSLPSLVDRFDPEELSGFLDSVFAAAQPLTELEPDMAMIMAAFPRCLCNVTTLLQMILDRRLGFVGQLVGTKGVPALVIRPQEVLDLCAKPRSEGWRHGDLKRLLGLNSSTVSLLLNDGWISSATHRDPRRGHHERLVSEEQLDTFNREYATLSHLARDMKTLPRHAARILRRAGVHPVALPAHCSKIYRRAEIEAL